MSYLKKLRSNLARITRLAREARRNPILALPEYFYLMRFCGFTEDNIRQFKLLSPNLPMRKKREFVPSNQEVQCEIWGTLNPVTHEYLVQDKQYLYRQGDALGIPVPQCYALIEPDAITAWDGEAIGDTQSLIGLLRGLRLQSLVVKPTQGTQGRMMYIGVRCIDYENLVFADPFGRSFSLPNIIASCQDRNGFSENFADAAWQPEHQAFLIQQYIAQDDVWERWFGSRLVVVRVITARDDEAVRAIFAWAQVYGDDGIDTTQKIVVPIDPDSGILGTGVFWKTRDFQRRGRLDNRHEPFAGIRCPWWTAIEEVAARAAHAFSPHRALAWDFIISKSGPVVLEGNTRWGTYAMQCAYERGMLHGTLKELLQKARAEKK